MAMDSVVGRLVDCTLVSGDIQPGLKTRHHEDTRATREIHVNTARGSDLVCGGGTNVHAAAFQGAAAVPSGFMCLL